MPGPRLVPTATCAPAVNPEIVVTVLVEHGLHGGSASAPIAAKILNRYFEDKTSRQQGKTDGEQPGAQLRAHRGGARRTR